MDFIKCQEHLLKARQQRENSEITLFKAKERLEKTRRKKNELSRVAGEGNRRTNARIAALARQEEVLKAKIDELSTALSAHREQELEQLELFLEFTDPTTSISKLDDSVPILMFPLRIETRFKENQLWVRAFPDEIAVDTFEDILSENEVRNGRSYLANMWRAGDIEADQRAAWRLLADNHGPGRGHWITQQYKPLNPDRRPERTSGQKINLIIPTDNPPPDNEKDPLKAFWRAMWFARDDKEKQAAAWDRLVQENGEQRARELVDSFAPVNFSDGPPAPLTYGDIDLEVAFIEFPKLEETDTKYQSWTKAPTVNILPERLVFLGYSDNEEEPLTIVGNVIPSSLAMGPDPSLPDDKQVRNKDGDLFVNEELKWMTDFDEAVKRGMGFKINLTLEQAMQGFKRVIVLGVRIGSGKDNGQNLLETLIHNHHHSRKGFSLLSQGTPTNNTEKETSTYSWRHDPDDSFDIYFKKERPDDPGAWFDKRDGRWLAELLGINTGVLHNVANYYGTDQREAKGMNAALWPATLGYFMETMMDPVFKDQTIEQTRLFFQRYVSGRGMLPAFRVGRQPYGIVPATAFSRMNWFENDEYSGFQLPFLTDLHATLKKIDGHWSQLVKSVSHVGKGGGDAHKILLDIVGLHPSSAEFHYRYAQSFQQIYNSLNLKGLGGLFITMMIVTQYTQNGERLLEEFGYRAKDDDDIPDILKKFFLGRSDLLKGPLIDDVPLSETDPIRNYASGNRNYIRWLIDAAEKSHNTLRRMKGFIDNKPPNALLFLMLHHALDLGYLDAGYRLRWTAGLFEGQQARAARQEPKFIHIQDREMDKGSRWKQLYEAEPRITTDDSKWVGNFIATIIQSRNETAELRDQLNGLKHLENAPTARLERVFAEHLDTCAYRLDAWTLGLVNNQLTAMRHVHPETRDKISTEPRTGIYIGAYGWLEDVRSEHKKLTPPDLDSELETIFHDPLHPLMKDNTNGGFIHAPSLNHGVTAAVLRNGYISKGRRESFSINLSSERVRLALSMIEGVRNGQSMAALLGYQLERGLHDRHDVEVDEFIFDLRKAFPLVANRMVPTKKEGVDKIQKIEARNVVDGLKLVNHVRETGKTGYPFGKPGLPPVDSKRETAINEEVKRLLDINDAVADLAMAEGVHQAVQGNFDRAAATLDAYSKGHFPPTPDVIKTPRSGVNLTHRVGIHLGYDAAADDPANTTPRSKGEPAVNEWLEGILPPMTNIVCIVEYFDTVENRIVAPEIDMKILNLLPIDLLYMTDMEKQQTMTALEDEIVAHVINNAPLLPDGKVEIKYMEPAITDGKIALFELAPLLNSLRALVQRSRPLKATDIALSNEAAESGDGDIQLDSKRVTLVSAPLEQLNFQLDNFRTTIGPPVDTKNMTAIIANIDDYIESAAGIFKAIARFGIPETGVGSLYEWKRAQFPVFHQKIDELVKRLEQRLLEYNGLIAGYNNLPPTAQEDEKYALLTKAELKISSQNTVPFPAPDQYRDDLETIKKPAFMGLLSDIKGLPAWTTLKELYQETDNQLAALSAFDLTPADIETEKRQLLAFAGEIRTRADNLKKDIDKRLQKVSSLLTEHGTATDPRKRVELLLEAGKELLGEDFRMIPDFRLTAQQADEWHNAYAGREKLLEFQTQVLKEEFPVDKWLYGIARVKEKMRHLENAAMLIEATSGYTKEMALEPAQFPYHQEDYWLALEYPQKKKDGTDFKIEEDKLLYTAHYAGGFIKSRRQRGLLVDEWTEVIPTENETTGLTFHYDRPNSEPPQALLLVTPAQHRGSWQWQDLVDAHHETLDMAKKRAIEPEHVDSTDYARFLPALISSVTMRPITAMLNLSLNNAFYIGSEQDNE
jgi:hypothetical protein